MDVINYAYGRCMQHFSTFHQQFRQHFHEIGQFQPGQTCSISEKNLELTILLEFTKVDIVGLAIPDDIPLSYDSAKSIINRFGDLVAMVYGAPFAFAIAQSMDKLVKLHTFKDCPTLTPAIALKVLQRRLYRINQDPRFDVNRLHNGLPLEENLESYLDFKFNDQDLHRAINSHQASEMDSSQPAANPKPSSRKRTLPAAATTAPPTTRITRSATLPDAANAAKLKLWHEILIAEVGELKDVELPCLYLFAGLPPCHGHKICQKKTHKKTHVVHPLVKKHELVIKNWLKLDPLGRF